MPLMHRRSLLFLALLAACSSDSGLVGVAAPSAGITDPPTGGVLPAGQAWTLRGWASDEAEPPSELRTRWIVDEVVVCDTAAPSADGTTTCAWSTGDLGERAIRLEVSNSAGKVASATAWATVGHFTGVPTCGITSPVDGGTSVEGMAVELAATVGDVGVDGVDHPELLSIEWSSDREGTLGTSVAGADGQVTLTTAELGNDLHTLTLRATDPDGNLCADAINWSVDSAPSAAITAPLDGDVVDEGVPALLAGFVEDGEDLPGELWVRWESDRDGVLAEGPPDDHGETALYTDDLSRGEHVLSLTVTDPLGLESTAWVTVRVNGAPTAPTVTLSPTSPTGGDALVASLFSASVDPDGDALTYTYVWSRFGIASSESTSATLPESATTHGDLWTVDVAAFDGRLSSPVGSASVTIENRAPVVDAVTVSPATFGTDDEVTAVVAASDPDDDPLTLTYDWYVDGALVQSGGIDALGGMLYFNRGQSVWVTATASDGSLSTSASSAPVVVGNSAPTAPGVVIEPSAAEEGDPLTCTISAASDDPDGDPVTYTFAWDVDGAAHTSTTDGAASSTVDGADVLDGEVWTCTVVADDGLEASEPGVASVTVGSQPSTCQEIRDALPTAGDGDYTLYVEHDGGRPWSVYCHDMEGTPTEYLSVPSDSAGQNTSYEACDGAEFGTPVTTVFTRVRVDPVTFRVDPNDYTFSASTGDCHTWMHLIQIGWGVAASCDGRATGVANVDISGTPFVIQADAWAVDGYLASGTATYSADNKVVNLSGGGYCGYLLPADAGGDSSAGSIPLSYEG